MRASAIHGNMLVPSRKIWGRWIFCIAICNLFIWTMVTYLASDPEKDFVLFGHHDKASNWLLYYLSYLPDWHFPADSMPLILAFYSGMFGAVLSLLMANVFPEEDFGFAKSDSFYTRSILGGLSALSVLIILAAGSDVLSAFNTSTADRKFDAFIVATVGILSGVFSNRIGRWLSEQYFTIFEKSDPETVAIDAAKLAKEAAGKAATAVDQISANDAAEQANRAAEAAMVASRAAAAEKIAAEKAAADAETRKKTAEKAAKEAEAKAKTAEGHASDATAAARALVDSH